MIILLLLFCILSELPVTHSITQQSSPSLNEFDTYNADKCQRIRRPWHKLTPPERDLYISGLLKLRENGQQSLDIDELIAIGSVHVDTYAPFIHKTSSYLFWHGYLTWELESRIRNLGGKYSCFGMPYWDFTLEVGREDNPLILQSGLGGNGNPNNYHTVNQYSWPYTIEQYWTPTDCYGVNDKYPICALKRSLRESFMMPDAKTIGNLIINNPNFVDFASYSHTSGRAVHLIDGDDSINEKTGEKIYEFTQSYEPIWYLFHSFIQYHQGIWTDCNQYDQINVGDLHKFPEAFTAFCNSDTCIANVHNYPKNWLQWELDDKMHFGGKLIKHEWSFINKQDLTVRKLYNLPKWNIIYDLDDGTGFYTDSGLKDYCMGKLNNSWFMLNDDEQSMLVNSKADILSNSLSVTYNGVFLMVVAIITMILCGLCYAYKNKTKQGLINDGGQRESGVYGSMKTVYIS